MAHLPTDRTMLEAYRFALDQSSIVAITDTAGKITYVNDKFIEISQYSREELLGQDHRLINSQHHPKSFFQTMWQTIAKGQVWRGEVKNKAKNGSYYWVDTTIVPFLTDGGRPYQYVAIRTDITEKIEALALAEKEHQAMLHMQKLEALGTLASGIAHDFNNILQGLRLGLAVLMKRHPKEEDSFLELLNLTRRGKDLIRQILSFSRKTSEPFAPLDLLALLDEASSMMAATLAKNIKINRCLEPETAFTFGSFIQLLQVVVNLCTNAAYAMQEQGGTLTLSLKEEQDAFLLSVEDEGQGIPEDVKKRIFEPFYTTKPQGEGTGMGLSVVHGIITQHGGDIKVSSTLGKGSTFTLSLPKMAPTSTTTQEIGPDKQSPPLKIALVDDDVIITRFASETLRDLGHEVTPFHRAQDLLADLSTQHWDVIISDWRMPELDGLQMAEALIQQGSAQIPLILVTGNKDHTLPELTPYPNIKRVIQKPFGRDEIQMTLAEIFG